MIEADDNNRAALSAALAAAQAEFGAIGKRTDGQVRGRRDYRYADLAQVLEVIRPTLARHGIAVTQSVEYRPEAGGWLCVTHLAHAGYEIASTVPCAIVDGATPQEQGSAITYARRYGVLAAVGAHPTDEDDDGASASGAHPAPHAGPTPADKRRRIAEAKISAWRAELGSDERAARDLAELGEMLDAWIEDGDADLARSIADLSAAAIARARAEASP